MVEVRPMTSLDEEAFRAIGDGYVTSETYRVSKRESPQCWQVELQLVPLPVPTTKVYPDLPEDLVMYSGLLPQGFSSGAWDGSRLVGSLIAELRDWNGSLFIWDIRVADDARRRGIGRQLIDRAVEQARAAGLRIISLETQNS
jgi:ribosomal protein S18 acetylase RimI-like enzyme